MEFLTEEYEGHLLNPLLHLWKCYESKLLMFPNTWPATHHCSNSLSKQSAVV